MFFFSKVMKLSGAIFIAAGGFILFTLKLTEIIKMDH